MSDQLYLFSSEEGSNTTLVVKSPDKQTAIDIAARASSKGFSKLRNIITKWAFIDANNVPVNDKNNMETERQELTKLLQIKKSIEEFISTTQNLGIGLNTEVTSLQNYLDTTVNPAITTHESNLDSIRTSYVVFHDSNL